MTGTEKTAFVLAGGGTKGAFEAGAISYLVEVEAITPQVITATSAGAICAAVLAQARTHAEVVERSRDLHNDLLAMTHTDRLFGKQPWVQALQGTPFGRAIDGYVTERTRPPVPGEYDVHDSPPVTGSRARRRLDMAMEVAKALPQLGRSRRALKGNASSILTLEPLAAALRNGRASGIRAVDPALIARPGLELRMAVVALGAGVLRYVTQDGTIVGSDAVTPVPGPGAGPVDVLEGMLSSASVPMLFPPRRMADDIYVDGGVANNVPVDAAVRIGATRIFAILAVPVLQPPDPRDYTTASAPAVFLRAVGAVAFSERQLANLNPPLPDEATVTVIDPLVDVVGPFEVSQGLMLLDMDYGWMRAADVLADVDEGTRRRAVAATDATVTARTRAWHREESIWAAGRSSAADLKALGEIKRAVRDAVTERKGLGLPTPPDAERWWSGYEVHAAAAPPGLLPDPLGC